MTKTQLINLGFTETIVTEHDFYFFSYKIGNLVLVSSTNIDGDDFSVDIGEFGFSFTDAVEIEYLINMLEDNIKRKI